MKAKAVVFPDKLKVEFREVSVPEPGPDDVVVETRYSWISNGTEGSYLRGERINGETPYRPGDPWPFPVAAGYQSTGVVRHVGANVTDIEEGQWVFCALGRIDGMYDVHGGHISEKVAVRAHVWPLPDALPEHEQERLRVAASGLVLTQVGYNCGTRPPVDVGDTALVIGDGLVGQWAAQTLHWRGASVILAGRHDDRLAFFPEGERRYPLNTTKSDLVSGVRAVAPSGVSVLVDTVGSIPTILECHPLMRHNGHIVSAGFNGLDSMLDVQKLRFGELSWHAPSGWQQRRMDETLALIASGHLKTEELITHRFPAERAAEAWKLIVERPEPVLGVLLEWA
ncbi:MAG: zinc-binding dehydrogenase [Candidatus Hydrogenedentes bacterium]|nr:zinc-binding dehydrogenase [Candidatus Hydrogenedentota bacterium]